VQRKVDIKYNLIPERIISSPLWVKASITGTIISIIVVISKLAGPIWGGIFATFPAITISTMIITIKSGGIEISRLIAKNVIISTTTTVSIFALLCYVLFPIFGVILGTFLAYCGLLIISMPLFFLFFNKRRG
jgi:hypothetical protein